MTGRDSPECLRCGKCCFEPFCRHVRDEDLAAWRAAGREDIVAEYEKDLKARDRSRPEMAALGLPFHTCRLLRSEGEGRFACAIHPLHPLTCREFEAGCSRLCPQYRGRGWREKSEKREGGRDG
jgi:Fe-S-cluster containining protein